MWTAGWNWGTQVALYLACRYDDHDNENDGDDDGDNDGDDDDDDDDDQVGSHYTS